ncbi:MAG: carbohydrate ABC transporter permease [Clostridia bacterium]|jgi:multiple sugar transport system permease protein|nr:carbohydrate ABC transporter permease [Spirochaetia bacterium]
MINRRFESAILGSQRAFIYACLFILAILSIGPIWIMLVNATRSTEQIQQGISFLPGVSLASNWEILTGRGFQISQGFMNSSLVAVSVTLLTVYFSAMTAYGFHIYDFRGKKPLFAVVLTMIMVPPQLGLIGFYRFMAQIRLLDSFLPLIIPAIAAPSTVFFIRQYLRSTFQKELVESARIDGATEFKTFNRIILPVISPCLATMAIFAFVGSWNNFITPYILISDKKKYTLTMLVQLLRTDIYKTEFGGIYLGIAICIVPILIFFAFMSKYIIAGVAMGGLKE